MSIQCHYYYYRCAHSCLEASKSLTVWTIQVPLSNLSISYLDFGTTRKKIESHVTSKCTTAAKNTAQTKWWTQGQWQFCHLCWNTWAKRPQENRPFYKKMMSKLAPMSNHESCPSVRDILLTPTWARHKADRTSEQEFPIHTWRYCDSNAQVWY